MADELTLNISLSDSLSGINRRVSNLHITVTGDNYLTHIEELTTSEEDLVVTGNGVVLGGIMILRNLSNDTIIQWGPKSAGVRANWSELYPKEFAIFHAELGVAYRANTVSGEASLEIIVIEE